MKIFLGGTCNGSKWREYVMPLLEENDCDYFNPVVDDWNEAAQKKEIEEREKCDFCLYTITPRMKGVYSIAEVVEDSIKRPHKTILCIKKSDTDENNQWIDFEGHEIKALEQVAKLVERNGGKAFTDFRDVVDYVSDWQRRKDKIDFCEYDKKTTEIKFYLYDSGCEVSFSFKDISITRDLSSFEFIDTKDDSHFRFVINEECSNNKWTAWNLYKNHKYITIIISNREMMDEIFMKATGHKVPRFE